MPRPRNGEVAGPAALPCARCGGGGDAPAPAPAPPVGDGHGVQHRLGAGKSGQALQRADGRKDHEELPRLVPRQRVGRGLRWQVGFSRHRPAAVPVIVEAAAELAHDRARHAVRARRVPGHQGRDALGTRAPLEGPDRLRRRPHRRAHRAGERPGLCDGARQGHPDPRQRRRQDRRPGRDRDRRPAAPAGRRLTDGALRAPRRRPHHQGARAPGDDAARRCRCAACSCAANSSHRRAGSTRPT